jgi:hypothetical protein
MFKKLCIRGYVNSTQRFFLAIITSCALLSTINYASQQSFKAGINKDSSNIVLNVAQIAGDSSRIVLTKDMNRLNFDEFLTVLLGVPINILAFVIIFTGNYFMLEYCIKDKE